MSLRRIDPCPPLPYHNFVAVRKTSSSSGKKGKANSLSAAIIFWLIFIIGTAGVFLVKRDTIQKNFNLLFQRLSGVPDNADRQPLDEETDNQVIIEPPASIVQPGQSEPYIAPPETAQPPAREQPEPSTPPDTLPAQQPTPAQPRPVETRERNIYFTQIDNDGQILRSRVTRNIAVSDSPMQDAMNALLAGPSADERNRGIVSLIPQNTRILSILVRGSTAYISFSEDFQFNTYGVEGYAAQIRQIVWTATEFPTVNDVQILIEGRRVDYLGEGIWIGSPINRQSL